MPTASRIASEIGTSMFSRRPTARPSAERKKGCPAKMTVGSAIAALIQWNRSRVARRGARPDRDRQQHDVHHGESRDAQPHQQLAPCRSGRSWHGVRRRARAPRSPPVSRSARSPPRRRASPPPWRASASGSPAPSARPASREGCLRRPRCSRAMDLGSDSTICRVAPAARRHVPRPPGRRRRPGRPRSRGAVRPSSGVPHGGSTMRWRNSVPSSAVARIRRFQLPGPRSTGAT
jgi:hypothetical protein